MTWLRRCTRAICLVAIDACSLGSVLPLISVIIPAYNQADSLPACLESVLAQPVSDLEILVVDDGSTDGTASLVRRYAAKEARIRLYQQSNGGAGAARNLGLRQAKGRYVHFLDADDSLIPGAYAHLRKAVADYPGADVLLCHFQEMNAQTGLVNRVDLFGLSDEVVRAGSYQDFSEKLLCGAVVPWNRWISRTFLARIGATFDEIPFGNDRTFHFKVVTQAKRVVLMGESLVRYTVNNPRSLAGRVGVARLTSLVQAFKNISAFAAELSVAEQRTMFSKNMEDVVRLYERSPESMQREMAQIIVSEVHDGWMPFAPRAFPEAVWQPSFGVMRAQAATHSAQVIPIAFAVDEGYLPQLCVTLQSISETLDASYHGVAYVLHLGLPEAKVEWLETEGHYGNISIFCVDLRGITDLKHVRMRAHYSHEIYLRLWAPELLKIHPKVIYLDADLIVRRSLHELLSVEMSGFAMAGVRDFNNHGHFNYVKNQLGLDPFGYVNSGVLIFDVEKCLAQDLRHKCFELMQKHTKLSCPDQDVLNMALAGQIKLVDSAWNYLWNYGFEKYCMPPDGPAYFSSDLYAAKMKKYIIHYSSAYKPWRNPNLEDADIYWSVARRCPAYAELVHQAIQCKLNAIRECLFGHGTHDH